MEPPNVHRMATGGLITASAFALETAKAEIDIPVIGVVKPGAKVAAERTKNGRIGVIGTECTIHSGIYNEFLSETNPLVKVSFYPARLWKQKMLISRIINFMELDSLRRRLR